MGRKLAIRTACGERAEAAGGTTARARRRTACALETPRYLWLIIDSASLIFEFSRSYAVCPSAIIKPLHYCTSWLILAVKHRLSSASVAISPSN